MRRVDRSRTHALGPTVLALAAFGSILAPADVARAAGGGGRLLLFFFALPACLPLLGMFAATIGLRRSQARWLWASLCALLALNATLLGLVFRETAISAAALALTSLELAYAATMVFTFPEVLNHAKWKVVLWRIGCVLGCGVIPALLTALTAR